VLFKADNRIFLAFLQWLYLNSSQEAMTLVLVAESFCLKQKSIEHGELFEGSTSNAFLERFNASWPSLHA
jgi:hypothetical protein